MIKFLVDEGSFRYILSGALLGVELNDLRSAPVSYLETLDMFPMDFMEFITSLQVQQDTIELLRDCFENRKKVDEFIHERLIDAFYLYLIIGGMPEAIKTYIDTNDLQNVKRVHEKIIREYNIIKISQNMI